MTYVMPTYMQPTPSLKPFIQALIAFDTSEVPLHFFFFFNKLVISCEPEDIFGN